MISRSDPKEADIQSAYFKWVRFKANGDCRFEHIIHVPNGAHLARGAITFRRLQSQGFATGFPDIAILVPRGDCHGVFIELKRKGGKPSSNQTEWIKRLNAVGYLAFVIDSLDELIEFTEDYLQIKKGPQLP